MSITIVDSLKPNQSGTITCNETGYQEPNPPEILEKVRQNIVHFGDVCINCFSQERLCSWTGNRCHQLD